MANTLTINAALLTATTTTINAVLDDIASYFDSGSLKVYDSGDNLKATFTLNATAFAAASGRSMSLNAISNVYPSASGSISGGYAVLESSDTTKTLTGDVGTSGAAFNFSTLTLDTAVPLAVTSGSVAWPS